MVLSPRLLLSLQQTHQLVSPQGTHPVPDSGRGTQGRHAKNLEYVFDTRKVFRHFLRGSLPTVAQALRGVLLVSVSSLYLRVEASPHTFAQRLAFSSFSVSQAQGPGVRGEVPWVDVRLLGGQVPPRETDFLSFLKYFLGHWEF